MHSYDPARIGDQGKDYVRFRIGDVDPNVTPNLEDEEIEAIVALESSFSEAVAKCAEALAARLFSAATTKQLASVKVVYESRCERLLDLAAGIRNGSESIAATDIVITGTTKTELLVDATDTDVVQPAFRRGQFENPASYEEAEEVA